MKTNRLPRRLLFAAAVLAVLVLAAIAIGLQGESSAQNVPEIGLDAPVSFPVDI